MLTCAAALRTDPKDMPNFMTSKAGSIPALQPSEVYDSDYPIDMAKLTPEELRYKAQADYARAIAMLKREKAEAEAAQREMERALKAYQDALAAAKKAKLEAEEALRNKSKYSDAAVDAETNAKHKAAQAASMKSAVSQEEADLAAADKAYQDALAGKEGAEAKLAAMKQRHAELCKKIQELEAESASMGHTLGNARSTAGAKKAVVNDANQDLSEAGQKASREAQEAAQAKKEAEDARARLAEAEKHAAFSDADRAKLEAEIADKQAKYEDAKARYMREQADADRAHERAMRAKKELAKYETAPAGQPYQSGAATFGSSIVVLAITLFA